MLESRRASLLRPDLPGGYLAVGGVMTREAKSLLAQAAFHGLFVNIDAVEAYP